MPLCLPAGAISAFTAILIRRTEERAPTLTCGIATTEAGKRKEATS